MFSLSKNLIICCDGTGNKVTVNENSNVVHLFSCFQKNDQQICFYSPGIGTNTPLWKESISSKFIYKIKDLVRGYSLKSNVLDAYKFLMDNYNNGDKIFLFGFSRGAYTVRVIAGLMEMFGLLHIGNHSHINQLFMLYKKFSGEFEIGSRIKKSISRNNVKIEFLGIWDTVSSIGPFLWSDKNYPYTEKLGNIQTIRHAVAIDEKRKKFQLEKVNKNHSDLKEVYFAGVHSDVGGSYPEEGLSKISLVWMLSEAVKKGLKIDPKKVDHYVYGKGKSPYKGPDLIQSIHNSFTLLYWFTQIIPIRRKIKGESRIHYSVFKKMDNNKNYKPRNLQKLDRSILIIEN